MGFLFHVFLLFNHIYTNCQIRLTYIVFIDHYSRKYNYDGSTFCPNLSVRNYCWEFNLILIPAILGSNFSQCEYNTVNKFNMYKTFNQVTLSYT